MPILFPLLLVGVSTAFSFSNQGNESFDEPIASSGEVSFCVDLCYFNLRGNQCVEKCLATSNKPFSQYLDKETVCLDLCFITSDILSCSCDENVVETDFGKIYEKLCTEGVELAGCLFEMNGGVMVEKSMEESGETDEESEAEDVTEFDEEAWCKEQCANGNGGSACNCDILPLRVVKIV